MLFSRQDKTRQDKTRQTNYGLIKSGFVKCFLLSIFSFFYLFVIPSSVHAATYTVTKTADTNDGVCNADCSLREAVAVANSNSGADIINFNIPTSDGGYIGPSGSTQGYFSLPVSAISLTDDSGVFIDGYSQPGATRNTAAFGETINTVLKIQIIYSNGTNFLFTGDNNHIAGLNYQILTVHTVDLSIGSTSNWIEGNFFGSDITGTIYTYGGSFLIRDGGSSNIFGTNGDGSGDVGERNLFMGHLGKDYAITGYVWSDADLDAGDNNVIAGNYFGVDKTGRVCPGADIFGQVVTLASSSNRVGTNFDGVSDSEEPNIIGCINKLNVSDNPRGFIRFFQGSNNYVQGNYVGISPHGDALGTLAGTGRGAVSILAGGSNGNVIKGNTISNGDYGILQSFSGRNTFSQNRIYGNVIASIKLGSASGPLSNDAGDVDSGPNDLMNYPVITSLTYLGNSRYRVDGTLDFLSSESPFTIEVCLVNSGSNGYGGCDQFLGSTATSTTNWSATVTVAGDNGTECRSFTTFATNTSGSTGEFGLNATTGKCSIDGPFPSYPDYIANAAKSVTVVEKNNVISMVGYGTFRYDASLSVNETLKTGSFRIPGTNYWQGGGKYEIWWKSFFNDAKILSSEVRKPFTLIFKYDPTSLEKSIPEKSLKIAYSADNKGWKVINSNLDIKKKELVVITKNGGHYMIIGKGL